LCLGLIMSSVKMKLSFDVGENAVLKLLMQPALMAGAALMLSISGVPTQQMILLCALPSATISGMFANEAGAYRDEAATSILFSTTLSIVTFSFFVYLSMAVSAPPDPFTSVAEFDYALLWPVPATWFVRMGVARCRQRACA